MKDQGMKGVQQTNFAETFRLFYQFDRVSKQTVVDNLGHSLPTVTGNLKKLLERELIVTDGEFMTQKTGRPAQAYTLNRAAFTSLGMAIFGDHITLVNLDSRGEIANEQRITITFANTAQYYKKVMQYVADFIAHFNLDEHRILGLGIGIQGLISDDRRYIVYSEILEMTNLTVDTFQQYVSFPVIFIHDADAVALAEQYVSKREEDAIYLSIGEHLGTAMMVNGQIYNGSHGRSGTMEHITLAMENGRQCYCGRRGCIETYLSVHALLHDRNESLAEFFELVNQDDEQAVQRWFSYLEHMAAAIVNLHMFVDSPIILAGELASYLTTYTISEIEKRIAKINVFPEESHYVELGQRYVHPVAVGAALPLMQLFIEGI